MSDLSVTDLVIRPSSCFCVRKIPTHKWESLTYPLDSRKTYRCMYVDLKIDGAIGSSDEVKRSIIMHGKCEIRYNFVDLCKIIDSVKAVNKGDTIFFKINTLSIDYFLSLIAEDGRFSGGIHNATRRFYEDIEFNSCWSGFLDCVSLLIYKIGMFITICSKDYGMDISFSGDSVLDIFAGKAYA